MIRSAHQRFKRVTAASTFVFVKSHITEYSVASPSTSMGLYSQNKWAQERTEHLRKSRHRVRAYLGDFVYEVVFNSLSIYRTLRSGRHVELLLTDNRSCPSQPLARDSPLHLSDWRAILRATL
jgi:hypothetical protein